MKDEIIKEILDNYHFPGELVHAEIYGSGHINTTFVLEFKQAGKKEKFIGQKINQTIFKDIEGLMGNIIHVTDHLRSKIRAEGGDPDRETLTVLKTKTNKPYFVDGRGNPWRIYHFIHNCISYDLIESTEVFYQSAKAFGKFQKQLADFPAHQLHETIKDFHNTKKRYKTFKKVVEADVMGRAEEVQEEINFILEREHIANELLNYYEKGEIPLRVTHNDTKTNNVLMDQKTGQAVCVVDLDTVMPGLAVNDFGDSIRFGTNTAAEDETDLSKVTCDLERYDAFTKGFLEALEGNLTDREVELLPLGALTMTYESALRFLADHLEGDVYFHINRPNHNLDRARTQIKLVQEMEAKWDQIQAIVDKYK